MRVRSPLTSFTSAAAALLVVGSTHANAPAGRYTIPTPGAVYDTKTKLTWTQMDFGPYTWGSASTPGTAQNYCATLTAPLGTGWRLPTIGELGTLVDYSQANGDLALIDPTFFPNTALEIHWSSTLAAWDSTSPWGVDFKDGDTISWGATIPSFVFCVR
jgi:hypothetical protein